MPWRHAPTPYQVWVSELMLQQTQVATVIPYYDRWIKRFPNVESLAAATLDEVNQLWAGLGYYRRASYLHRGASYIVSQLGGEFPKDIAGLRKITGIGAYTAGAIASFAFDQNVPAIDGNAERVMSRYFGIFGDVTRGEARKTLENAANDVLSYGRARIINQAVMDLGAGICGKKPDCAQCPLQANCYAYRNGLAETLPQKKSQTGKWLEYRAALLLKTPDHRFLIAQRQNGDLLGNLWEFPMIAVYKDRSDASEAAQNADLAMRRPRHAQWSEFLTARHSDTVRILCQTASMDVLHIFTHIRMHVAIDCAQIPVELSVVPAENDIYSHYAWVTADEIAQYPISTLMKKLLRSALGL